MEEPSTGLTAISGAVGAVTFYFCAYILIKRLTNVRGALLFLVCLLCAYSGMNFGVLALLTLSDKVMQQIVGLAITGGVVFAACCYIGFRKFSDIRGSLLAIVCMLFSISGTYTGILVAFLWFRTP